MEIKVARFKGSSPGNQEPEVIVWEGSTYQGGQEDLDPLPASALADVSDVDSWVKLDDLAEKLAQGLANGEDSSVMKDAWTEVPVSSFGLRSIDRPMVRSTPVLAKQAIIAHLVLTAIVDHLKVQFGDISQLWVSMR